MKRAEWNAKGFRRQWEAAPENEGKNFLKERRKDARTEAKSAANKAVDEVVKVLGLTLGEPRKGAVEGRRYNPSAQLSTTEALTALVRFKRKMETVMYAASDELGRRYAATSHGRDVDKILAKIAVATEYVKNEAFDDQWDRLPLPEEKRTKLTAERKKQLKALYKTQH